MSAVHLGVDVGQSALFVVMADETAGTLTSLDGMVDSALPALIAAHEPISVSIDAPNGLSARRGPGRRHCEVLLGIGGCYATPSDRGLLPPWMETGLLAHETAAQLLDVGPPRLDGAGKVFEVHPTYGFRSLLGVRVSAQRCATDPPPRLLVTKQRPAGRVQRRALVAALASMLGLDAAPIKAACEASLDITDAAMAALLCVLRARKKTHAIGDAGEGTIVIADLAPAEVASMRAACASAAAPPPAPPPPSPPPPSLDTPPSPPTPSQSSVSPPFSPRPAWLRVAGGRVWNCAGDGALLRLGAHGPGGRSQADTCQEIDEQLASEGDVVFPLSKSSLGDWGERARREGFPLVIALRNAPLVVLHVIDIRPGTDDSGRARWTGEGAPDFWVIADDGWYPSGTLEELLQTSSEDGWVNGLGESPGQSAWRCMRVRGLEG